MLIDLSVPELFKYEGRNPRPDDFDAYWDNSLAEMRALDPQVELKPVATKASYAELFDMRFTGVGGARVYAKLLKPKNATGKGPALVYFHGYTASSGEWSSYLRWVAQGFTVAAMDCRGQGGLSEDVGGAPGNTHCGHIIRGLDGAPKDLLYRSIFLDCAQLAGLVMGFDWVDAGRVAAHGGSQGGGLTLACAALEPRIARAAPLFPFLSDYLRVWEMDLAEGAYREIKDHFRRHDPRHERETEIFTRLGYIDIQHLAPRIRSDVLMSTGLMDAICPPSSQFAAYNKITSKKRVIFYPDFGHEGLTGSDDLVFDYLADL